MLRFVVIFILFAGTALADETTVEAGFGQADAEYAQVSHRIDLVEWLRVRPYVAGIERDGARFALAGFDLEVGRQDRDPWIVLGIGPSYWKTHTERIGTNGAYHIGISVGYGAWYLTLHHFSNGDGYPFGDCDCENDGENLFVLGRRFK